MKILSKPLLTLALSAALFGCNKSEISERTGAATESKRISLSVGTAVPPLEEGGTKVTFDGTSLVWEGAESMDVLIGNSSTTAFSQGQSAVLSNDGENRFVGEFALDAGFSESDIRAIAIPAGHQAWVRGASEVRLPIAFEQTQKDADVMNGENFPLWAPISSEILAAAKKEGNNYRIDSLRLRWGCAIIRFNVYGEHSAMEAGEVLESISLITDNYFSKTFSAGLSDNALVRNDDADQIILRLQNGVTVNGRTSANGIKMYMAIFPGGVKLHEVQVKTDKGIYTLKTSYEITGEDLRGHVYQLGLNLSKFERVDRSEFEYYYNAVLDVTKRSYLPSIQLTYTEPGKTISFVAVNDEFYSTAGVTQETMPLNIRSVYTIASMSKPPLAYFTMKMKEEGLIDLMHPLYEYYPGFLSDFSAANQEKAKLITAKMALLHTTGLGNETYKAPIAYSGTPGYENYSYSGCGVWILSRTLANIKGTTFPALAKEYMFDKIGMDHTSYAWQDEYELCHVYGHQELAGASATKVKNWDPNVAHSLRTTTEEYTKNLKWIMSGADLSQAGYDEMMAEYLNINSNHTSQGYIWRVDTLSTVGPIYHHRGSKVLFHGWMCFVPSKQATLAFFTNGTTSFNFNQPIAKLFLGEEVYALKGHGQDLPTPKEETGTGSGSGLAGEYGIIRED